LGSAAKRPQQQAGQAQSHGDSPLCPRIEGIAGWRERHHAPPDTPLLHAPAAPRAPVRTRRPIRHLAAVCTHTRTSRVAGSCWRLCRRTDNSRSSSSARVRPAVERTNSCMARACDVPARTCPRAALPLPGSRGTTEAARSRAMRHGTSAQAQHSSAGTSALRRTPCATRAAPWPAQMKNRGNEDAREAPSFFFPAPNF
jgi:hypothetical protein